MDKGRRVIDRAGDLADPFEPSRLVDAAVAEFGHLDVLVANHAQSGEDGSFGEITAEKLDSHWAVNTRSTLLLTRDFANQFRGSDGGRVIYLTSGQHLGPLPGEIAYGASKAALAGITATVAYELAPRGITVNCLNPGPVDAGYFTAEMHERTAEWFPFGRPGEPDDPARLISWLVSSEAKWMTGQILNTEGGFNRTPTPLPEN